LDFGQYLAQYATVNALVKGPPGSGKTCFAASASRLGKTLVIEAEGGLVSARKFIDPKNLEIRDIRSQDPKDVFSKLSEAMGEAMGGGYEFVVLDSFVEVVGRMEDEYSQSSSGKKDWYILMDRVKKFARILRDLPCSKIITCLTRISDDEEHNKTVYDPLLAGSAAGLVPSMFDINGYMKRVSVPKGGEEFVFVTTGPSLFKVRDRTGTLAPEEKVTEKSAHLVWEKVRTGLKNLKV
jgi:hypothetical protein